MTTVTGRLIGAAHPERVEMVATLVDATGKTAVGYVASVPGELVKPVPITADTDGAWTVDLTANSLITSQSGDTLWAVQEGRAKDGTPTVTYIAVPETGGPYWAGQLLADLSSTQTGSSTVVYLAGPAGTDGASAYQVAVANGFVGTEAEWLASLVGPKGDPGSGGGAVDSVNGLTGVVVLDADSVSADPAGAAASAQSAATSAAATDATAKVAAHTAATDPHGDRAAASSALAGHVGAADPHGDRAYADGKLAKASNLADLPDPAAGRASLGLGTSATRNVGTAAGTVAAGDDARLSDARTPTAHAASHAAGGSDPVTPAAIGADPAGTADAAVATHSSDTTSVHGIADTTVLETTSGAQAKADSAQAAATSAAATDATSKVTAHTSAIDPHGDRAYTDTQIATRAPASRQITAGTGLTGGGSLAADRTLAVSFGTTAGTAAAGNDARLTDARTPTAHASSHATGGSDPVSPSSIGAEASGTAAAAVTTHAGAVDPHGDRAYADGKLAKSSNLSDLASASTARTNLGLGGAAVLNVGTAASTVAAGDDSRITGAAQKAQNLADLQSAATARTNLGLGGAALLGVGTSAGTVAAGDDSRITGAFPAAGGAISGNLAVAGNALGQDFPAAHGVAAWCYDPALAVNSTQLTAGTLYLVRVNIAANVTATKIYWWVANTGSGATANQNLVGLYDSAGTLLASANVDASFSSATLKTTTIASTALSAGSFYWVGLLFNASVPPTLTRASGWTGVDTAANLGLSASAYRFAKNGTGRTSLPASITPASNIGADIAGPWVAVGA